MRESDSLTSLFDFFQTMVNLVEFVDGQDGSREGCGLQRHFHYELDATAFTFLRVFHNSTCFQVTVAMSVTRQPLNAFPSPKV